MKLQARGRFFLCIFLTPAASNSRVNEKRPAPTTIVHNSFAKEVKMRYLRLT
jgi:hypothetical protein